jgi:hypothetical protein
MKTNSNNLLFLSVLLAFFASLPSCKRAGEKAGEHLMETAIEKSGGGPADVDIDRGKVTFHSDSFDAEIKTEAREWPGDIPDDVPRFNYGIVAHTTYAETENTRTWGVFFKEVPLAAAEKYEQELKQAGFKTFRFASDEGASVSGEKGSLAVSATFAEGGAHVSVHEE